MCYIKLFLGLQSPRFTYLSMLKQQTQYWAAETCWKIYWCFLLSTVVKPLHVGFSHLLLLTSVTSLSLLSPPLTALPQQFGTMVCSSGLLPAPAAALPSSEVLTGANRWLENRSKFFLNIAAAASLEHIPWAPKLSLGWENLISWC